MLKEACTVNFSPTPTSDCDPCRHYYFKRVDAIRLQRGILVVTSFYDFRTCFIGLGKGPYLNTITMMPGEQIEVEIVRRSKYTRELHEESSIETEFETSFEETTRNKFNVSGEYNFETSVGGGFSLFGIGAKAEAETSMSIESSYEHFNEIVQISAFKVSRQYDIAIDTKTEFENEYRSLRRIRNPNPCHPVLFMVSQIMKKYKSELELIKVEFDFIPNRLPSALSPNESRFQFFRPALIPFNGLIGRFSPKRDVDMAVQKKTLNYDLQNVQIRQPEYLELNAESLLQLKKVANRQNEVKKMIARLKDRVAFKPGIKFSREFCLRTSDIYIESKISPCSACCQDSCEE